MTLASEARAATGLTQREFAAIIDVDPAQIGRWSSGARSPSKPVISLLVLIKAMPQQAVTILAQHHGVTLKKPGSADPAHVQVPRELKAEFIPPAAGDRDAAGEVVIEEPGEDSDGFVQLPSGYLMFPDRGINPSLEEDEEEPPAEVGEDDAGFAGDGGPPPGRAPADEDERTYGPNRRGDRGKRRAVDEQVPDYTPEFGYTGGQEEPGGG